MGFKIEMFFVLLVIGFFAWCFIEADNEQDAREAKMNDYMREQKPIKEMTSFIATNGELSGSFLLIAGGVYGHIDTQHVMSLVYGTTINGEKLHRTIEIPFDQVDIVTIPINQKPYFIITDMDIWTYRSKDNTGDPLRIKLFLPEGWQILNK